MTTTPSPLVRPARATPAAPPTPGLRARVRRLGRIDYAAALEMQEESLAAVTAAPNAPPTIFVLEHDPVYTLGRGADEADLMGAPQRLGVPTFRVGRGGGATFHGPGQVVAYPIVRLAGGGRDVQRHIRRLERALVATCAAFDVEARTIAGQTGVWARGGKIAAIGIGVRRGVSLHGVALNVTTRLDFFASIVPCRAPGLQVTTMARELAESAAAPAQREVEDVLVAELCRELALIPVEMSP